MEHDPGEQFWCFRTSQSLAHVSLWWIFNVVMEGAVHPTPHTSYLLVGPYQLTPSPHLLNVHHLVYQLSHRPLSLLSPDFVAVPSVNKQVLTSHFYTRSYHLLKFVFTVYILSLCYWVHTDLGLQHSSLGFISASPAMPLFHLLCGLLRLPFCCLYICVCVYVFVCSPFSHSYTEARLWWSASFLSWVCQFLSPTGDICIIRI